MSSRGLQRTVVATALLTVLPAHCAVAQSLVFEKAIDAPSPFVTAEWGYAVRPTRDGGYVAAGFTATTLFPLIDDMLLVKTNGAGDTLWTRAYGGEADDGARDVLEVDGGGFVVLGTTQSFGAGSADVFLVRTDAEGRELWRRTYGGPRLETADAICAMPDGGWMLVGSASDDSGDFDIYAVRTDALGDIVWERRYGGPGRQGAAGVCRGPAGGAVITGHTATAGLFDACLLAVAAGGDSLWARTYGGADEDWGSDVAPTQDGGFFVTGTTGAFFGAGFSGRAWALRTDAEGGEMWSRTFGVPGASDANANAGQQTAGGYVLAGSQISPAGDLDVFVARLDAAGDEIWSRRYDRGGATDHGADVLQSANGIFVVTGYTHDLDTWYDVYLAGIRDDTATDAGAARWPAARARVVPNPFSRAATLAIDPVPGLRRWHLALYDAAGRRVRRHDVRDAWQVQIDRDGLAAGTYLYRIQIEGGAARSGKLTIH